MYRKFVKLFLRLALASAFFSAVGDRFGLWPPSVSAWGNWDNFLKYTATLNPLFPQTMISLLAIVATIAEVVFGCFLLVGFKTEIIAKWSGVLLLLFALSMTFSTGIKTAFDASVFSASAGAFALSLLKEKYLEVDSLISRVKK